MKSVVLAVAALLLIAGRAAAAPLEAYGLLPQIEDVQISPDGSRLAIMKTRGEQRTIAVVETETMKPVVQADAGNEKVRSIMWADNENLVFTITKTGRFDVQVLETASSEYATGVILNVVTKKQRLLGDANVDTLLLGAPEARTVDGETTLFFTAMALGRSSGNYPSLMRMKPDDKFVRLIKPGSDAASDWLIGPDGTILAEFIYKYREPNSITILGKKKLTVRAPEGFDLSAIMGLGPDGTSIIATYYPADDADGEKVVAQVSMETGEWIKPPMSSAIDAFYFDPRTRRLLGHEELKGDTRLVTYLQPGDLRTWNAMKKAFSDSDVRIASWSADRRKVVVRVDSPTLGPAYALVNLNTGAAKWIGDVYPIIDEDISPVRPISYKAADGTTITGYLTIPYGAEAKNLPLIVLPHGGPAARDTLAFDWWQQALASRGYAVLQPNFRGSDGFGVAFRNAGHGEWGRKMQTDLSDGVRYLAARGIIDPKRVCIGGASYGGYAALAGATIDRGVYRCAVAISGPSDLKRILATELRTSGRDTFRYWTKFMGVKNISDPKLAEISPVLLADRVEIPVMLIHGKDDSVVLYEHSTRMAQALTKAGKPVELVTLEGEDHWLSKPSTRLKMLRSMVAFIEKHNPPNPPAQTASLPAALP